MLLPTAIINLSTAAKGVFSFTLKSMLGHGSGPGHTTQARQGPLKTAPISRHDYVCMSMESEFKVIENNALPSTIIFMKLVGSGGVAAAQRRDGRRRQRQSPS